MFNAGPDDDHKPKRSPTVMPPYCREETGRNLYRFYYRHPVWANLWAGFLLVVTLLLIFLSWRLLLSALRWMVLLFGGLFGVLYLVSRSFPAHNLEVSLNDRRVRARSNKQGWRVLRIDEIESVRVARASAKQRGVFHLYASRGPFDTVVLLRDVPEDAARYVAHQINERLGLRPLVAGADDKSKRGAGFMQDDGELRVSLTDHANRHDGQISIDELLAGSAPRQDEEDGR